MHVLMFTASWCMPCKTVKPILEKLCTKHHLDLTILDVDKAPSMATKYNVRSLPTIILLHNGKEVRRIVGTINNLEEKLLCTA
jgi:thioredoxin-like negative regulator of GroEL